MVAQQLIPNSFRNDDFAEQSGKDSILPNGEQGRQRGGVGDDAQGSVNGIDRCGWLNSLEHPAPVALGVSGSDLPRDESRGSE